MSELTTASNWENVPLLLTIKQASELLQISETRLRDLARLEILPAKKLGRSWRINKNDLQDFLGE